MGQALHDQGGAKGASMVSGPKDPGAPTVGETPRSTLFRSEVFEAQERQRDGRPLAIAPPSWAAMTVLLGLMAATGAAVLYLGSYERVAHFEGRLRAPAATASVLLDHPAVVTAAHVRIGERVKRGQPIATVANVGGAEARDVQIIRAPIDGRIWQAPPGVGTGLEPRAVVFSVAPSELAPRVIGVVSPRHAAELRAGQAASMRLATSTAPYAGSVAAVRPDPRAPEDREQVEIQFDDAGAAPSPRSGQLVTVEVKLGRARLRDWIFAATPGSASG